MLTPISYTAFKERTNHLLREDKLIVIDEFQRLPEELLDLLHYLKPVSRCKLVLIDSSMQVAKNVLSRRSHLLELTSGSLKYSLRPLSKRRVSAPYHFASQK